MKLAWSILFLVICNAEQVIGTWWRNSVDHQTTGITPVKGKHLRLLASPVSRVLL
jgi:DNA-binding transcriptional regulator of glucitol operon